MDAEKVIIDSIENWSKEQTGLVIGIDGYSGAGKTTLLKSLAGKYDFLQPVYMDNFVSIANTKEKLMPQIESNSSNLVLEWKPDDGLEKLKKVIKDFKLQEDNKFLVVEGIFLFHNNVLRDELDKIIYLDTNKEQADERRVKREKERWGEKYFPEDHPDSFARLFKIAFSRYEELYKPKEKADLVISLA